MKITKDNLNKIHEMAKFYYLKDSNPELSAEGLVSQAWTKAVMSELCKEIELELPERIVSESVFDD